MMSKKNKASKNKNIFIHLKNLRYEILVFILYILSRLPSLGHDTFNTDVWKWKSRIYNFGNGVFGANFIETIQRYHPGVTLMWLGALAVKINSFYYKIILGQETPVTDLQYEFTLHFLQKLVITLALGLTLVSVFYVLKRLVSPKYAALFIFLIVLEPFYTALTRVVHLEGLLATFMLASFIWLTYFTSSKNPKTRYLVISALFGTFSVLTKTSALALLPFTGLALFISYYQHSNNLPLALKKSLKLFVVWFGLLLLFCFIFWPALWVNPIYVLESLYRGIFDTGVEEGHMQIYFGNFVNDPGWTFYFVVFGLRSSLYLFLGFLGFILIKKGKYPPVHKKLIFNALLLALIYFIEMTIPSKKLDRYLLPTMVLILIPATFTVLNFIDFISTKVRINKHLVSTLVLSPAIFTLVYLHPDYFSYYSPIFGGLNKGIHIIEPKWIIGTKEIATYTEVLMLNGDYETFLPGESVDDYVDRSIGRKKFIVAFQEKYYTQIYPFIEEYGGRAVIKDLTGQAKEAKYFVYPVWEDDTYDEDRFKLEFVGQIKLRGTPVYNVYKRIFL